MAHGIAAVGEGIGQSPPPEDGPAGVLGDLVPVGVAGQESGAAEHHGGGGQGAGAGAALLLDEYLCLVEVGQLGGQGGGGQGSQEQEGQ